MRRFSMMGKNNFISSIDPSSLQDILDDADYVAVLEEGISEEGRILLESSRFKDELRANFRGRILPEIDQDKYRERVAKFSRLFAIYRFPYAMLMIPKMDKEIKEALDKVVKTFKGVALEQYWTGKYELSSEEINELRKLILTDLVIYNEVTSGPSMLLSELFFSTEYVCKLYCAISCLDFAVKICNDRVIQHTDVWKTLKKLAAGSNLSAAAYARIRLTADSSSVSRILRISMHTRSS